LHGTFADYNVFESKSITHLALALSKRLSRLPILEIIEFDLEIIGYLAMLKARTKNIKLK